MSQRLWECICDCGNTARVTSNHLNSGHVKSCGCLRSEKNSGLEMLVRTVLNEYNVTYYAEHVFDNCVGAKGWKLRFDFFLPDYNVAIECDGEQHFKPVEFFGGEKAYKKRIQNDNIKNNYCLENSICLVRVPYTLTDKEIIDLLLSIINT